MQTANVNVPIRVTGRHIAATDAIKEYAINKIGHIHLDYPRIIEAHIILDVEKHRHIAEIVLHCANHITIEADHECNDLYAAIDGTVAKIAQQMRKYKTKLLRNHRPRRHSIRHINEHVLDVEEEFHLIEESVPKVASTETYAVKPMFLDEAVLQIQISKVPFVIFHNAQTEHTNVLHRREDGKLALIELEIV